MFNPQTDQYYLLIYFSGDTTIDNLTTGAYDTRFGYTDPANRVRAYAEIVRCDGVTGNDIALFSDLTRTYQAANGADNSSLRLFNNDNRISTDLVVDGLEVTLPLIRWTEQQELYGATNAVGIAVAQVVRLTLKNVRVTNATHQGIFINRCMNVLIDGAKIEMMRVERNPLGASNLYCVQLNQTHYGTVRNIEAIYGRYGVTLNKACSNLIIEHIVPRYIHPSGATADIHGGDCLNITFRNFDTYNRGLSIGNPTWRRGGSNITVENVNGSGIGVVTSARNVTIQNCRAGRFTIFCTDPDDGNGFNNSTGANQGYPSIVEVSNSAFSCQSTEDRTALALSHSSSTGTIRASGINFSECTFTQPLSGLDAPLRQYRAFTSSTASNLTFIDCIFEYENNVNNDMISTALSGITDTGPVTYQFNYCAFKHPDSTFKRLIRTGGDIKYIFAGSTLIRGGASVDLTCSNLNGQQLVEKDPTGATIYLEADGTTC